MTRLPHRIVSLAGLFLALNQPLAGAAFYALEDVATGDVMRRRVQSETGI